MRRAKYLSNVLTIIEASLQNNIEKVFDTAWKTARRMEKEGDNKAAQQVRTILCREAKRHNLTIPNDNGDKCCVLRCVNRRYIRRCQAEATWKVPCKQSGKPKSKKQLSLCDYHKKSIRKGNSIKDCVLGEWWEYDGNGASKMAMD